MIKQAQNEAVYDRIVQTRVDLLMQEPFFGQLAVRLTLVEADDWCPTMAVDGYRMYYNTGFVTAMSDSELKFVIAHEIMHCVYQHFLRRDDRHPRLWNCAGDYVINIELRDCRIGTMPKASSMPGWEKDKEQYARLGVGPNDPGGLIDDKYKGWTSEEVYDDILEDAKNGGKHADDLVKNWDIHLELGDGEGGEGDGEGDEGGEGKSGPGKLSKEEIERLKDELKKAVIDASKAAEEMGRGAGNLPAGVKRLIKEWTESKIDWREYVINRVNSTMKSDYTWTRSSRKGRDQGIYLPGMDNDDMVTLDIAVDTSGSTYQDIPTFLGEIRGIMEQFADYKIRVWCFDTQTYTIHEFTPDNVDEMNEFPIEGMGGTEFGCNWEMMKDEDIRPETFLMFTDGYPFGTWGDPDYCDTIFLIKGGRDREAPFGMTLHYEDIAK